MPFNPDGSFTLAQEFGTGVAPDNQLPPKIGDALDDIAAALDPTASDNPYLAKDQNLADLTNVTTAQQNLNLEPGVDVMAFDPQLTAKIRMHTVSANYTLIQTDAEKCILIQSLGSNQTITIPTKASASLAQGDVITVANYGGGTFTSVLLPAGGVSLFWSSPIQSGTRTLAAGAVCTMIALLDDQWALIGSGIS